MLSGRRDEPIAMVRRVRIAMRGQSWTAQQLAYATALALGADNPLLKASYDAQVASLEFASGEKQAIDNLVAGLQEGGN